MTCNCAKISYSVFFSFRSQEWKRVAIVMQMSITCQHYSLSVVQYTMPILIWKPTIINHICWIRLNANQMMDPAGIANWSVTYVDWSEGKWHPRSFRAKDVTYELLKNMTVRLTFFWVILIFSLDGLLFSFSWDTSNFSLCCSRLTSATT